MKKSPFFFILGWLLSLASTAQQANTHIKINTHETTPSSLERKVKKGENVTKAKKKFLLKSNIESLLTRKKINYILWGSFLFYVSHIWLIVVSLTTLFGCSAILFIIKQPKMAVSIHTLAKRLYCSFFNHFFKIAIFSLLLGICLSAVLAKPQAQFVATEENLVEAERYFLGQEKINPLVVKTQKKYAFWGGVISLASFFIMTLLLGLIDIYMPRIKNPVSKEIFKDLLWLLKLLMAYIFSALAGRMMGHLLSTKKEYEILREQGFTTPLALQ